MLVNNDAAGALYESATFCKANDDKRPAVVGTPDGALHTICPTDLAMGADELTDAAPQGWYVRVMFDELLDPGVEQITELLDDNGQPTGTYEGSIKGTAPVTLKCESSKMGGGMVDIPYDGYYSPAGNNVTWPLGPSLVIKPDHPELVATNSECVVTLKDKITDKDHNQIPMEQRGPFKFKVAPVEVVAALTAPADGDSVDGFSAGVDITFNTVIDPATLVAPLDPPDGTETFDFTPHAPVTYVLQESDTEFFLGADFEVNADYTFAMKGGAKVKDQCGRENTLAAPSVAAGTQVEFTTNALKLNTITPFDGQMSAKPSDRIKLVFNQYMNPASLLATEFSISPAVPGMVVGGDLATGGVKIGGEFSPNTDYTFTLNAGATIDDCPGGENLFGGACTPSAMGGTYTNASAQVIHYHTAAIALTGTTPKNNGTVAKSDPTDPLDIILTFNQDMDYNTLQAASFTIDPAVAMTVQATTKNSLLIESDSAIPAGTYTFTLKGSSTIKDVLGNTYTHPADTVIHFKVTDPGTTPTAPTCY